VLRLLASRGVFAELEAGQFAQTPLSEVLRGGVPGSVRDLVIVWGHPTQWQAWGRLLDSVRTGRPAFDAIYGKSHYAHLATDPEDGAMFRAGMAANLTHAVLADVCDLSGVSEIVDVGGGNGRLLAAVLLKHPDMRGVLLDAAAVVAAAEEVFRAAAVADRCRSFPQTMRRHLLISTTMALAVTGGQIRTEGEFAALFAIAGFSLSKVIPTPVGHFVLEARPAV
jgi:hypothetical protein